MTRDLSTVGLVRPKVSGHPPSIPLNLLGVDFSVATNDSGFVSEFSSLFGPAPGTDGSGLKVTLESSGDTGRLTVEGDDLESVADYLLSFASPTVPFRSLGRADAGWDRLALGESDEEAFRFRDGVCEFRKTGRWRRILSHLLFLRLIRHRPDLLFFHAASVTMAGQGILLSGPKGTGKTTLSLALASRGWPLLGDETAAYRPETNELIPFPRPVAIKPGHRARRIDSRIRELALDPDEDGILRVSVSELLDTSSDGARPLRHLIFLNGFSDEPFMRALEPGREHLSHLQPLAASLSNASPAQRIFQMIRILNNVSCWSVQAGDADQTAELIESILEES